jgi:hypothetical protein
MFDRLTARFTSDPLPLCELRPGVPADLEQVVLRMMARAPAERLQTPAEVAAALEPFANPGRAGRGETENGRAAETEIETEVIELPVYTPTRSWVLLLLAFSTVLLIGAVAFVVFVVAQK